MACCTRWRAFSRVCARASEKSRYFAPCRLAHEYRVATSSGVSSWSYSGPRSVIFLPRTSPPLLPLQRPELIRLLAGLCVAEYSHDRNLKKRTKSLPGIVIGGRSRNNSTCTVATLTLFRHTLTTKCLILFVIWPFSNRISAGLWLPMIKQVWLPRREWFWT